MQTKMAQLITFFTSYPEIVLSLISFILLLILRQASRRRRVTLPTNWPLVGMLPALVANFHWLHDWIAEGLNLSSGNFVVHGPWFLSMDMFITADPANVRHIFNQHFANYPKGLEFSEIFDFMGNNIIAVDGDLWLTQRRAMHLLINNLRFRSFAEDSTDKMIHASLVPLLNSVAEREDAVDLQDVFSRFTFDLSCKLVLGINSGCLSPELPDVPFATAMDDAVKAMFLRHVLPPVCWKTLRRLGLGPERKIALARRFVDEFMSTIIETKRVEGISEESADDLLSSYMLHPSEDIPGGMSDEFLRDLGVGLMLAGRGTITAALTWFFWLITQNPKVESKIIKELESSSTTSHEIQELVYLEAAICETLRLYPPVSLEHKSVLKPDKLPSGHEVFPGKKILISPYAMARSEGVWGEDCADFKPERWITDEGKLRHQPTYKFLSFNSGPRTCLGKGMSFSMLKMVAATLVPRFQFKMAEDHVVKPNLAIVMAMKNGLKVKVKKRTSSLKDE